MFARRYQNPRADPLIGPLWEFGEREKRKPSNMMITCVKLTLQRV